MEIQSLTQCLNMIDHLLFDSGCVSVIRSNLKLVRDYIKQTHRDLTDGEFIEGGIAYLNTLTQINAIITMSYSKLDDENYKILRNKILDWYDLIVTHNDNDDDNEEEELITLPKRGLCLKKKSDNFS